MRGQWRQSSCEVRPVTVIVSLNINGLEFPAKTLLPQVLSIVSSDEDRPLTYSDIDTHRLRNPPPISTRNTIEKGCYDSESASMFIAHSD
jgi:hypothetical protein